MEICADQLSVMPGFVFSRLDLSSDVGDYQSLKQMKINNKSIALVIYN